MPPPPPPPPLLLLPLATTLFRFTHANIALRCAASPR